MQLRLALVHQLADVGTNVVRSVCVVDERDAEISGFVGPLDGDVEASRLGEGDEDRLVGYQWPGVSSCRSVAVDQHPPAMPGSLQGAVVDR